MAAAVPQSRRRVSAKKDATEGDVAPPPPVVSDSAPVVVAAAPARALDVVVVAAEPLRCIVKQPAMMKKKEERPMVQVRPCKPPHEVGKDVMNKPGHFAFSVWEDGVFKGTTYYKHSGKDS